MSFLGISSTPTLAFALCQLDASYTGPLIQVRRSSDNTVLDIGIVAGKLDTSTLLSFCSGTNGYVSIWYNQNGTGNNAVQNTTTLQPQIVTNGSLTVNMFGGLAAPGILFNNTTLAAPAAWANEPFSVIISFNNYNSNGGYNSFISSPFTTGSNRISLGTFQNNFDLQNLGQSDAKSPITYPDNQDLLINWTSSTGWSSGGTVITNPSIFYPSQPNTNYPFSTSSSMSLSYPSNQTIETTTSIGGDGNFSGTQYYIGTIVSFPSNLSASDLYTASINVANAIGIGTTGPAKESSASAEVLEANSSSAKITGVALEVATPIESTLRITSTSLEVLCSLVNATVTNTTVTNTTTISTMLIATARPSFDLMVPNEIGDFDARPLDTLVYDVGFVGDQALVGNTEVNLYVFRRDAFDYTNYSSPSGTLAKDLLYTDNSITISTTGGMTFTLPVVEELSTGIANSPTVVQTMTLPGIVWINNERIEFFGYSINNNVVNLTDIRRGTHNTRIGVEQRSLITYKGDGTTTVFLIPDISSIANVVVTINGPVTYQSGAIVSSNDGYTGFNINSSKNLNIDYTATVQDSGVLINFMTAPANGTTIFLANNNGPPKHSAGSLVYDGLYSFLPILQT
jgi:hypothetical protein